MAVKKRKNKKFQKFSAFVFVGVLCLFVLTTLCLNAIESALNIEVQRVQDDIEEMESVLDGLNTACQEKTSFDNLVEVARANGYELGFATTQIAAVSE